MSFSFQWPRFSDQFHADAIEMLNSALNKGPKPPVIADKIEVVELEMGTQPPELEVRDIGDLTMEQFRGIFRLTYSGDAHIVLRTKVQANPLNHKQPDIHLMTGSHGMLAAKQALVVPMLLRLSHFRLSSYVVLVVSKQKGITLVFKTDPLQNVDINSTFDSIAVIQSFIQRELEAQLRQMFREDLPGIIHRLSQQWVKAKVEAPYLAKLPHSPPSPEPVTMAMSAPDLRTLHPHRPATRPPSVASAMASGIRPFRPRGRTSSGSSITGTVQSRIRRSEHSDPTPSLDPTDSTFPEIENFDPTYGLRPEGLPTKSVFRSFGRLFANPGRGLADLAEESTDEDDDAIGDEGTSYIDWDDTLPGFSPEPSVLGDNLGGTSAGVEYETVPAVGGGTVTRPRVFHAHSQVHLTNARPPSLTSTPRLTHDALQQLPRADLLRRPHSLYNPYFPPLGAVDRQISRAPTLHTFPHPHHHSSSEAPTPPLYHSPPRRAVSPPSSLHGSSSHTQTHSVPTPPSTEALLLPVLLPHPPTHERTRRASFTSMSVSASVTGTGADTDARIVLRPALHGGALSTLTTLAHSNHTLSPYTRAPSHFTVRAGPRSAPPAPPHAPPRARRRRTHLLGAAAATATACAAKKALEEGGEGVPPSRREKLRVRVEEEEEERVVDGVEDWGEGEGEAARSEFDVEDMDRYFRTRDEIVSVAAASEPVSGPASSSLAYGHGHGLKYGHGYGRTQFQQAVRTVIRNQASPWPKGTEVGTVSGVWRRIECSKSGSRGSS
ncbi:hypothetical protein BJV74DRAFT_866459 [Russula compacta]|nr:hypothetical protein BJV74DRAFT_866459 [Russula compacta]